MFLTHEFQSLRSKSRQLLLAICDIVELKIKLEFHDDLQFLKAFLYSSINKKGHSFCT
jgi:hypothetical protein